MRTAPKRAAAHCLHSQARATAWSSSFNRRIRAGSMYHHKKNSWHLHHWSRDARRCPRWHPATLPRRCPRRSARPYADRFPQRKCNTRCNKRMVSLILLKPLRGPVWPPLRQSHLLCRGKAFKHQNARCSSRQGCSHLVNSVKGEAWQVKSYPHVELASAE